MNKDQHDFLRDRISKVEAPDRYSRLKAIVPPSNVRAAMRIVSQWEKSQEKVTERITKAFHKHRLKVYEQLHAGDYAKTLKAVQAFETEWGN